jgi:hypothetical protein
MCGDFVARFCLPEFDCSERVIQVGVGRITPVQVRSDLAMTELPGCL